MADENNNNKKLDYLKREEVRSMEKDVARLREKESETAREKIAQLVTGEEAKKTADLSAEALARAEERARMEAEAKEKLAQSEASRRARQHAELLAGKEEEESEEAAKERLRAQLKEAHMKEEEERRKFLENIAAKSGEKPPEFREIPAPPPLRPAPPQTTSRPAPPAPPAPMPPAPKEPFKFPLPSLKLPKLKIPSVQLPKIQMPKVPMPKVEGYFPQKPSIFEKIWVRVIISLFVLAVLATIVTFWYWYLAVRPTATSAPAPAPTPAAARQETPPQEPEITENFIGKGYHFPTAPRIIDTIILHSGFNTSNGDPYDMEGIVRSYKAAAVATHYLISRDGDIFQLAPDYAIAYHAGTGKMPDGRTDVNNFSVGISLVYKETESPNDAQYQSLSWLVKKLQSKYGISSENILGYKDIAPIKTTPWNFDWEKLKLLFSVLSFSPVGGAEFILKSLPLEKKAGQLFIVGFEGLELTPALGNFIKTVRPGGVILFGKNISTASQVKKLIGDLQALSLRETGLPLFIAIDQEGGAVSRVSFIKEKTGQPAMKNAGQAYGVGLERGGELKELGVNLNLAPVLDSAKSGDFLYGRSFQKSLEKIGDLAKAMISGQKTSGILTAIKHFPGYGGISYNPEEKLTALTGVPQTLHFQKAMEAKPELVMLASIILADFDADVPVAFSQKGISLLKKELGDDPLVITDDLLQSAFLNNFSLKEIVTLPVKAGADILLFSGGEKKTKDAFAVMAEAVRGGSLSEKLVDRAALRIIKLKLSL